MQQNPVLLFLKSVFYAVLATVLVILCTMWLSKYIEYDRERQAINQALRAKAGDIISYAGVIRQIVTQMADQAGDTTVLDFTRPEDIGRNNNIILENNVFVPKGGGIILIDLPGLEILNTVNDGIPPGWYLGRFNDVAWREGGDRDDDIMLAAYKISPALCRELNRRLTGQESISQADERLARLFVNGQKEGTDDKIHRLGNTDLTEEVCPRCRNRNALCVKEKGKDIFAFYVSVTAQ